MLFKSLKSGMSCLLGLSAYTLFPYLRNDATEMLTVMSSWTQIHAGSLTGCYFRAKILIRVSNQSEMLQCSLWSDAIIMEFFGSNKGQDAGKVSFALAQVEIEVGWSSGQMELGLITL